MEWGTGVGVSFACPLFFVGFETDCSDDETECLASVIQSFGFGIESFGFVINCFANVTNQSTTGAHSGESEMLADESMAFPGVCVPEYDVSEAMAVGFKTRVD